jgi:hypothetical protein
MSLASNYATVFKSLDAKKVIAYMKQRGHVSLLPQVVRILAREKDEGETITVAHEKDAKKFKDARIVVNPHIVGGYVRRDGSKLTDASFRRSLVEIYYKTVNHG